MLLFFSNDPFHSRNANGGLSTFWPFHESNLGMVYDLTEFIIYAGIPLFLIFVFELLNKTSMTVAVVGSRSFNDYNLLEDTLRCIYITEIISGGDTGADKLAEQYAKEKGIKLRVISHEENSNIPNSDRTFEIINNARLVVAFWDGKSQGTTDLINYARKKEKQIKIKYF